MGSYRVLLAEDDRAVRESVSIALSLEGYQVSEAADGVTALTLAERERPHAILLDVAMPRLTGLQVCEVLRAKEDRVPILIISAHVEIDDRVAGLDAGADDYVTKPFGMEEVLARLRALLRRTDATGAAVRAQGDVVQVADLVLDPAGRRCWRAGREITLTRTEFDLLYLLASRQGVVLTHSIIYSEIWGFDFGDGSRNLAVYIGYLRRKLEADHMLPLIHTVRGVGYTLRNPAEAL
ncbi:response regulator transcription factor [Streptomyces sp. NPDC086787]|uniref:response regulator transcription factor n=1 Tax=Streptomyces sp. NPDC086787 TaxID=3365759 RepID=UPI0037FCE386